MGTHTVQQGEHLSRIAAEYGFADYRTIWLHSNNAELKKKRQNPNVLFPGDVLFIPDREQRWESRGTDERHHFRAKESALKLRLVVENLYEKPIADSRCELRLEDEPCKVMIDRQGRIDQRILPTAHNAILVIRDQREVFTDAQIAIKIGSLDPIDEVSGQAGRLSNLGYYFGPLEPVDEKGLHSAVEEFQCDHGLLVDGICGPVTRAKLKQAHGC